MTKKTKKQITEDTNIVEALKINPNTAEILMQTGMGCVGCAMAQFETIKQGLKAHGYNKKEITEILENLNKK